MVISEKKKFAFVHIPKTAGSSVAKSLGRSSNDCQFGGMGRPLDTHATARQIKAHLGDNYEQYFTFAFVRNPWDRLYSWYSFLCQGRTVRAELKMKTQQMGFKTWLLDGEHILKGTFIEGEMIVAGQQRSQLDWITDGLGKPLVDFIGKFESIDNDYQTVASRVGLQPLITSKERKSNHNPYQEAYDDEMQEFVSLYFADDIRHFGYTFE